MTKEETRGRKPKSSANYFPLSVNSWDALPFKSIRKKCGGPLGYGIAIRILQLMAGREGRIFEYGPPNLNSMYVDDMEIEWPIILKVLEAGEGGLFQRVYEQDLRPGHVILYSPYLEELLNPLMEKRKVQAAAMREIRLKATDNAKADEKKKNTVRRSTPKTSATILSLELPGIKEEDLKRTKPLRDWVTKECPRITSKYKAKLTHEEALEIINRWPPSNSQGKPIEANRAFVKWLFGKMENWPTTYVSPGKTFLEWAIMDEPKWLAMKSSDPKADMSKYTPPEKPVYEQD